MLRWNISFAESIEGMHSQINIILALILLALYVFWILGSVFFLVLLLKATE